MMKKPNANLFLGAGKAEESKIKSQCNEGNALLRLFLKLNLVPLSIVMNGPMRKSN